MKRWLQRRLGRANKAKGDALEERVVRLFKRLGKWNVKRSVFLFDASGNKSEIDVRYDQWFTGMRWL